MRIREAEIKDSEEITKLHKRTVKEINGRDYQEETIKEWIENITKENTEKEIKQTNFYIAEEQGRIIGFVNFNEERTIYQIYVSPDHLDKGIGTKLLEKAEKEAREKGIKKIKGNSTLTAQKFFQKKGYKLKREIEYPLNNHTVKMKRIEKTLKAE